jgi:hypothetical protein
VFAEITRHKYKKIIRERYCIDINERKRVKESSEYGSWFALLQNNNFENQSILCESSFITYLTINLLEIISTMSAKKRAVAVNYAVFQKYVTI